MIRSMLVQIELEVVLGSVWTHAETLVGRLVRFLCWQVFVTGWTFTLLVLQEVPQT